MAKPDKTLNMILTAIDKDVKRIKKLGAKAKLDGGDALTLTRYASALDGIIERNEVEEEKLRTKLNKMSTDELIANYKKENPK